MSSRKRCQAPAFHTVQKGDAILRCILCWPFDRSLNSRRSFMASSMRSLKQKETMSEAPAPPPHWTSSISLFPIEKDFFFKFNIKLLLQEQGLQKVRSLMMKTTHHKIGQTLVILAQEWEVEVQ